MNALSNTFSPLLNHKIDVQTEVLVTVGAYGSLFCAVQGLINPGDEVCCRQIQLNHFDLVQMGEK